MIPRIAVYVTYIPFYSQHGNQIQAFSKQHGTSFFPYELSALDGFTLS